VRGTRLAGCEVGDDFGFAAFLLLLGPLVGTVVGLAGSAVASLGRKPEGTATWRWTASTAVLAAFSAVLLALFVIEALTNLW
jgi:hypothetical protein